MSVSGQGRTNYGMNMRGRSMIVMVDGVRLNSSRSDSRQLDSIDPFNINHIEVISGATSLYGGGSSGGLINIVTKKVRKKNRLRFRSAAKAGSATVRIMMKTWLPQSAVVMIRLTDAYLWLISVTAAGMTAKAAKS